MPSDPKDEREIRAVMKQQKGRSSPAEDAARKKHTERVRMLNELLNRGTEQELIEWLVSEGGMQPDSPEARRVIQLWRENRRS